MSKVSPKMLEALQALAAIPNHGWASSYGLRKSRQSLDALHSRGLAARSAGLGSMAFPQTSIKYRITAAGRQQLAELKEQSNG